MIRKTEGVVLKRFDFRETSCIATFFTRDHGKIKGVLKAIRKDTKKFGSSVDKFSVNDLVYYWHANADLHLVGQCDLKQFYFPIRQNMKRALAAQYSCELVDAIMPPEEPNEDVYHLMMNFLESLQAIKDINKLVHIFQIRMLHLSGFRPHIDHCLICQKDIPTRSRFSTQLGGLLCMNCLSNDPAAHPISKGAIASMLHIEQSDWQKSLRLGLAKSIQKELKYVLNNFLSFHLEKQVKSARYL
ncbi:MAG: DNA repair protein RecO [Candidatus Omnitrophota bacterium]